MPNYFCLMRNGAAVPFVQVDEEMCRHFQEPCDPEKWLWGWYNHIGFFLAHGRTFDEIKALDPEPPVPAICDWLAANFQVESGYLPKG